MMSKIKISIIVPCYNVEKWVGHCLDSLIGQTLSDIEIICIDDKSTDNTLKILKQYSNKDNRIKVVCNTQNCGLSETRNHGMRYANAPYIMFCDSDDWFADNMCEKMYNAITADDADLAICGTEVIYETDKHMQANDDKYFAIRHTGIISENLEILEHYSVCAWNKIYKRDIIKTYDVQFPRGLKYEDNYFYHAYRLWVKRVAFVPEKLYKYRRRAGSIMSATYKNKMLNLHSLHIAMAWYDYAKRHGKLDSKLNWFWGTFFYNMLRDTLSYSGKKWHKKCYDVAKKFIRQNIDMATIDADTRRKVEQIMHRTVNPRRALGGLIKIQTTTDETFLRAFGIKLWRIKYKKYATKYYFLGVRIFKKQPYAKIGVPTLVNKPDFDDANLIAELKKLKKFTYIPNPGNIGDMLIASATYDFMTRNKLSFVPFKNKHKIRKHIVYGGGGIWTADYEHDWIKFLHWFKNAERVVILPSSFNNCQKLIDVLDERFVVFCREQRSYEYMKNAGTKATILLDHDMAFRLKNMPQSIKTTGKGAGIFKSVSLDTIPKQAFFMRIDRESAGKHKTDLDVSDITYGMHYDNQEWINFCTVLMMNVINQANTVVTDRLHVAIMAHLLDKNVYMLDNTYGKLSAVYEHSMKKLKNVHFCTELPDLRK